MNLIEIDLLKGHDHHHPDIVVGDYYLAKINGFLYFGQFDEVWFGLTFGCNFGVCGSLQYDTPGYNSSKWQQLWKLEGYVEEELDPEEEEIEDD